jgi:hypothetical protein
MYDTETTTKATDREWVMHARIIRWPDARAHLLPQLLFLHFSLALGAEKKEVVTACIAFLSDNRFSASAKSEPNFEIIYVLTEANGF